MLNFQVRERLKLDIERDEQRLKDIEKLLEEQNRNDLIVIRSESEEEEEEKDVAPKFRPRTKEISKCCLI